VGTGVEVAATDGTGVGVGAAVAEGVEVAAPGADGGFETWPPVVATDEVPPVPPCWPPVLVGPEIVVETVSDLTGEVETRLTLMELEEDGDEAVTIHVAEAGPLTVPREVGSEPLERDQPDGSDRSAVTPEKVPVGVRVRVRVTELPAVTDEELGESDADQEGISLTTIVLEPVAVPGVSEPELAVTVKGEA